MPPVLCTTLLRLGKALKRVSELGYTAFAESCFRGAMMSRNLRMAGDVREDTMEVLMHEEQSN